MIFPIGTILLFDGKRTHWRVRGHTSDSRYTLLTALLFGKVNYSIIDWHDGIRGPMNIVGGGLGIFTRDGPDEAINEAIGMLEEPDGGWEVSSRNNVNLEYTLHEG